MMETPLQGRTEWSIPVRRTQKRRDSRIAPYHSTSRPSPRNTTPVASPSDDFSRHDNVFFQQPGQALDVFLDFFDLQTPPAGTGPVTHQHIPNQSQWRNSSLYHHTLAAGSQTYNQRLDGNHASPPNNGTQSQLSSNSLETWNDATFLTNDTGPTVPDFENSSDLAGSFGSFDSMLLATPDTGDLSISGEYGFPNMERTFGLPDASLDGIKLPDEFYQTTGQVLDPLSPDNLGSPLSPDFSFDGNQYMVPFSGDVYSTQGAQLSSLTLVQSRTPRLDADSMVPHIPWNSQHAQLSNFQSNANSGVIAFEPPRGVTYETHVAGEEYLQSRQHFFGPEPLSPIDTSWIVPSYPPSSYAVSHNSPHSQGSPPSNASSPVHVEIEHTHIFSAHEPKQKKVKGRQGPLTDKAKKATREVRDAKACWACHISKTKCSPCSPGNPCEQCARLADKRRFCKFECFNDPLESLHVFLVPDYHMGHFTAANVEAFVNRNASSWGTQFLPVQLSWGYRKLLKVDVVSLNLRSSSSEMGFSHNAIANGSDRPSLARRLSPPLGIPLAAMEEMESSYSLYIHNIVQGDLRSFVSIVYDDQDCKFAVHLLDAVCSYYLHGLEADKEIPLLRKALEMLITSTILERSLNLDSSSISLAQKHMRQQYAPDAVPRCAQRQIKLAFFTLQRQRILSVLKEWGDLMWTIHNTSNSDKKWALSFSVFILLTLVIDKTLGSAYYFCEGRIEHHGAEEEKERNVFRELVRLTQREVFERCKEIFHWKFKTRKAGKEACNPIRDGMDAFKGKKEEVDEGIKDLVRGLMGVCRVYDREIRAHTTFKLPPYAVELEAPYTDAGRLACIFLHDFLERP